MDKFAAVVASTLHVFNVRRDQKGQTTVEYIGLCVVIGTLLFGVAGIIGSFTGGVTGLIDGMFSLVGGFFGI